MNATKPVSEEERRWAEIEEDSDALWDEPHAGNPPPGPPHASEWQAVRNACINHYCDDWCAYPWCKCEEGTTPHDSEGRKRVDVATPQTAQHRGCSEAGEDGNE